MNLRAFFNTENWLADKNQLFPCLAATDRKSQKCCLWSLELRKNDVFKTNTTVTRFYKSLTLSGPTF